MFVKIKERPSGMMSAIPMLNETLTPYGSGIYAQRRFNIKLLVNWIQKTPEAVSLLRKIGNDIVTKVEFKVVDSKKMGRPSDRQKQEKEDLADEFFNKNSGKTQLHASVMDWMMTGDNFVWIGAITDNMIKEISEKYSKSNGLEYKESEYKIRQFLDEDFTKTSKFRYVPSETVEIDYDDTEIKGYIQSTYASYKGFNNANYPTSGFQKRYWTPDQIIHGKFMEMSGKVYGYTPMSALAPVIRTLGLIKDYAGTFFQNGGVPDWMFMFESVGMSNLKNIEFLKTQLQKYKTAAMKHGTLVGETSGRFQAIKLSDFNKDMEFRQLMIMYAGLIALSFDFPSARMKSILGSDIKSSTGETDAETDSYERSIASAQDYICGLWNTQLWIPHFGVKMQLFNSYRQDEVREAQTLVQNLSALKEMVNLGMIPTDDAVMEIVGWSRDKFKSIELKQSMNPQPGQMPNDQVIKGKASQAYQNEKKRQVIQDKNKQMGN